MSITSSPVAKAWCNLAALVLILGGTGALTLGGVPELVFPFLVDEKGSQLTDEAGTPFTADVEPASVTARHRYMQWAVPSMGAITVGMILQALEPVCVILTARRRRKEQGNQR